MLIEVKRLRKFTLHALDGEIGKVEEVLFDDECWTVRYLIVDTGGWLSGRKVLISPVAFGHLDWERHQLDVSLTREQIQNSPGVETDEPVSRQWESNYNDYYGWPYYWVGSAGWGISGYPGMLLVQPNGAYETDQQKADDQTRDRGDSHLRSTREVTGYEISATDGDLGHVQDFIVDDTTWQICYLTVYMQDWWAGKQFLLPPTWIERLSRLDRSVTLDATRDQVKSAQNRPEGKFLSDSPDRSRVTGTDKRDVESP